MRHLRADRFVTMQLRRPFLRTPRRPRVPILMYHGIREGHSNRHPYFETNTSPDVFAAQMRVLHENGYTTVRLEDVTRWDSTSGVPRPVAITFDDGYSDFYTEALPVLARYGFHATAFVVSGFAAGTSKSLACESYMTWSHIRESMTCGITIGSHTVSHPALHAATYDRLRYELEESKRHIEDETGSAVRCFAHPFAFPENNRPFVIRLRDLLRNSGYANGVCTSIGRAHPGGDPFCMPRIPVNSWDDLEFFTAKLDGYYDWLRLPQMLHKYAAGIANQDGVASRTS